MPWEVSRKGVLSFLYGSAPGLRVAGAGYVVSIRSLQTPTHRSSSEPASSKRPSPMGRLAASLPRPGGVGEPCAPSRAASSSSEPGGPSSELGLGAWPRPAAAALMAARAAICARCIRALSGSLSSSGVALVRAGGSGGGGGCRASSSWRARCCRCRSVSITACSFMALRAGPPRAPGGGGGGGPCGEGARPHFSVGAAGVPGQCRGAGAAGLWPRAGGACQWQAGDACFLILGTGEWRRLAGGSFTCVQKPTAPASPRRASSGGAGPARGGRMPHVWCPDLPRPRLASGPGHELRAAGSWPPPGLCLLSSFNKMLLFP